MGHEMHHLQKLLVENTQVTMGEHALAVPRRCFYCAWRVDSLRSKVVAVMSYGRSLARPPSVVTTDTACIDNHIASWTLIYWRCQFNTCMRSVFNNEAIFSKLSCINFQGRVPHCTWRPSAMCNEVYKMY